MDLEDPRQLRETIAARADAGFFRVLGALADGRTEAYKPLEMARRLGIGPKDMVVYGLLLTALGYVGPMREQGAGAQILEPRDALAGYAQKGKVRLNGGSVHHYSTEQASAYLGTERFKALREEGAFAPERRGLGYPRGLVHAIARAAMD